MRFLAIALIFATGASFAAPVTWTLEDVFVDGYEVTGSFVYDTDTNEISSVYVNSGSEIYTEVWDFFTPTDTNFVLVSGTAIIGFDLTESMTNGGGTIDLVAGYDCSQEPQCGSWETHDVYAGGIAGYQFMSGSITAVPVPAAAWLFGSALAGLGWMRRKQTA